MTRITPPLRNKFLSALLVLTAFVALPACSTGSSWFEELGNAVIAQDCSSAVAMTKGVEDQQAGNSFDISWYQFACPEQSKPQAIENYTRGYLAANQSDSRLGRSVKHASYQCFLTEYDRIFSAKAASKGDAMDKVLSRCNTARVFNKPNNPGNYWCQASAVVCQPSHPVNYKSYQCFLTEHDKIFKAHGSSKGEAMAFNKPNDPNNYSCQAAAVICEEN